MITVPFVCTAIGTHGLESLTSLADSVFRRRRKESLFSIISTLNDFMQGLNAAIRTLRKR